MMISARFPAVAVAAALAISLTGNAANAGTYYEANPINVSFGFAPTAGTTLTANTGNLATATTITATPMTPATMTATPLNGTSGAPFAVTTTSGGNIGLTVGTNVFLGAPVGPGFVTPITLGAPFSKSFMTPLGPFTENLTITLATFTAGFAAATAGVSSLTTQNTLVINATGTISFTGEETGDTGFLTTPVFYAASYTQPPGGAITGSFTDTTVPLPGALPLFATGLGALGLLGWRRKRKAAAT